MPKVTSNSAIIFLQPGGLETSTSRSVFRHATIALIRNHKYKSNDNVHMYTYIHAPTHKCTHKHMHIRTCTCTCKHTRTYIYTPTHMYTIYISADTYARIVIHLCTTFCNFLVVGYALYNDDRGDNTSCGCLPACDQTFYRIRLSSLSYPSDDATSRDMMESLGVNMTYMK